MFTITHASARTRRPSNSALATAAATAALGAAWLLTASAAADTATMIRPHPAVAARACTAAQTRVWLGNGPGGGTAGTIFYPLEFSNVGRTRCTLTGYPGVSAWGAGGKQVGRPAVRLTGAHRTVTLAPGATAHAILGIHDWGAICSRRAAADGLRVFAPGQRASTPISFPFGACATKSVLVVEPVRAGVGIPGFTTS